jgi:hypothetical protein
VTRCAARRVVTPTDGDRLQQASPRENLIKNKYFCSQLAHAVQQLTYACAAAPFSTAMARHACSRRILTILFYFKSQRIVSSQFNSAGSSTRAFDGECVRILTVRETLRVVRVMGRPCGNNIYTSHCKLRGGLRRLLIGTLEKYLGRLSAPRRIAGGA